MKLLASKCNASNSGSILRCRCNFGAVVITRDRSISPPPAGMPSEAACWEDRRLRERKRRARAALRGTRERRTGDCSTTVSGHHQIRGSGPRWAKARHVAESILTQIREGPAAAVADRDAIAPQLAHGSLLSDTMSNGYPGLDSRVGVLTASSCADHRLD